MNVPECVAFIPDGNRRWAQKRGRQSRVGHAVGLGNCRLMAETSFAMGVRHVVIWAASESNLAKRSRMEVTYLFRLLKSELHRR